MRFNPRILVALSGLIWLAVGIFLFSLGSSFILQGCKPDYSSPYFSLAQHLSHTIKDPSQCAVVLMCLALFVGYLKGRFVLSKAAYKQISRLYSLPRPVHLKHLYTLRYYILLGGMVFLGISMRYLPISLDVRGVVDVAIGMALISGALQFIRNALIPSLHTNQKNETHK